MSDIHWMYLLLIGACTGLMLCFSLFSRPQTRPYRIIRRIFWSGVVLLCVHALGGPGVNPMNVTAVSLLGGPGLGALWLLKCM